MVCQPSKLPEEITTTLRGAAVILGNHHRCDTCSVLYEHPVQIGVDWTSRCEANITIAPMPVSVFSAYSTSITTLNAFVKWEGFTSSPVATSSLEKRVNVTWPQGLSFAGYTSGTQYSLPSIHIPKLSPTASSLRILNAKSGSVPVLQLPLLLWSVWILVSTSSFSV